MSGRISRSLQRDLEEWGGICAGQLTPPNRGGTLGVTGNDDKETPMTTTTQLPSLGHYTSSATITDSLTDYLGDFADEYDVTALADLYRAAINEALAPSGIVMCGDEFYATYPSPVDADDLVRNALDSVSVDDLVWSFEQDAACEG